MIVISRVLLLLALVAPLACSSAPKDDEPLLTEEQRAELQKIVDKRMAQVTREVRLSKATQEDMQPTVRMHMRKLILASRKYRANPTPKALRAYDSEGRKIGAQMKKDLQPLMTNAQLQNFMIVIDQVLQDVRGLGVKSAQ
jgi:coenzyme F420-reducing hydrogenase alpha subunit